ncbi:MAG: lipoate--protein ligase family protein [Candidatus Omnitrophica bacterium]|nr:lipoate--protein ligase family protein [Candidatus Omnitrophota bacterium]MDD5660284.1 lipoate--protein ligase family protein [Candidatus Omnitrophota bacterium]
MKLFKLLRSSASSASYNMAVDAEIFRQYLEDGIGLLRLYRWERPSFTYGFSQNPEEEIDFSSCASEGVGVAKRITGGGILFHHDEITYSFVCSKTDVGEPQGVFVSYRNICAFLMQFYKSLGLDPIFALQAGNFKDRMRGHQLCSASNEKYDITIGAKKIGGNAQKRKRQAIFQHGSIPCSIDWNFVRRYIKSLPSDIAEHVTTLGEELKVVPEKDILEEKLIEAFESTFGVHFYETCVA